MIDAPPAPDPITGQYEIDPAIVDHLEFYLLDYFKPGLGQQNATTYLRQQVFNRIGCNSCHMSNFQINHDRRVADVGTFHESVLGIFINLFPAAITHIEVILDHDWIPPMK